MNLRRALLLTGAYYGLPASLRSTFANPPGAANQNAFPIFLEAGGKIVKMDTIIDMTTTSPKRLYSVADKTAVLHANAACLTITRSGLRLPYASPPLRTVGQPSPYFRQFRTLAHLLTLDADVRLTNGDAVGAIQSSLDAIQFGQQIERGESALGRLVGNACQAIAQRRMGPIIDRLPADAAKRAAKRLESIYQHCPTYAETLREEKLVGHAYTDEAFAKNDPTIPGLLRRFGGKRQIVAAYDRYKNTMIRRGEGRFGVTDRPGMPPPPSDPIDEKTADVLWTFRFKIANIEQTQNALLMTTLALRAYRLEHRRLPATLTLLCPTYLNRVPEDEFAARGPLRYRVTGPDSYLLYSVGPDGVDGGGRAINNPARNTEILRRLVEPNSVGDIIAGINF